MSRRAFQVPVSGGHLGGWVEGSGPPVLLLHGGPGMSASYMYGLVAELASGYEVALYQQRGLPPSMEDGPFSVATHIDDVKAVMDALNWGKAYLVGHSWGGHLALHVAATLPQRLIGLLAIDPAGGVGDGGMGIYEATLTERVPPANRARLEELDRLDKKGELTPADAQEGFALMWPGYFADPNAAPPALGIHEISLPAMSGGFESMAENLPTLEKALSGIAVPAGFVAAEAGPMPVEVASQATADRMPNAWVEVIPNAGHFVWLEAPGAVRKALDRLVRSS